MYRQLALTGFGAAWLMFATAALAHDEKALREIGRWPWPRSRTAGLVEAVGRAGPKAQFHDWMVPEK